MAILLSILLGAATDAGVAVYLVLRRSAPRYEALTAAASITLREPRDRELFDAILLSYQATEAERNALAHGVFGVHPRMPKSVLWVELPDAAHFALQILRQEDATDILPPVEDHKALIPKMRHYTVGALDGVRKQIRDTHTMIFQFNVYLRTGSHPRVTPKGRDLLYDEVSKIAPIQEALRALRETASRNKRSVPLQRRARRRRMKRLTYKKP